MNWFIENWYLLIGTAALVGAAVAVVKGFTGLPNEAQVEKIKEWLIWACIEAEKQLQSGTGQLKLRQVYDMFCAVPAFTWVAKVITFKTFSEWVSDALVTVKQMIVTNDTLAQYVYGDKKTEEVAKIEEQLRPEVDA